MDDYRIYFLTGENHIQAAYSFAAESDEAALAMAGQLFDACSDVSNSFELWLGGRKVGDPFSRPALNLTRLRSERQETLVRHEEALRESAFRIAKSQRLLEKLSEAKRPRETPPSS